MERSPFALRVRKMWGNDMLPDSRRRGGQKLRLERPFVGRGQVGEGEVGVGASDAKETQKGGRSGGLQIAGM